MKRLLAKFKRSFWISQGSRNTSDRATSVATLAEAPRESTLSPKAGGQNYNSRLESLPPEVRRHLLSTLDLPRLKLLVRSSPIFHQQYLSDRRYVLCESIEKTLGSVTVDAYTVHLSAVQANNVGKNIPRFLKTYSENTSRRCLTLVDKLTQDEAQSMVRLYFHSVKPITDYFARGILHKLAKIAGKQPHDHQQGITLTSTEIMRLTRATYRFQLLCQMADPADLASRSSYLDEAEATILAFFDTLEPWEIEELFSFYEFVQGVYENILNDVSWDLNPNNPRFDNQDRPPTPTGAFELDNYTLRNNYLEGITLRGVSLLRTVLFKIKDHDRLVSTIQRNLTSVYIPINDIEGVLGESQHARRRETRPSERDRMQDQRAPCPFRGDCEPDAPPLAWTAIWNDTYSNLYGCYIPDALRQWGYIFWDAATLEDIGVLPVLKQAAWEDDPRDYMML